MSLKRPYLLIYRPYKVGYSHGAITIYIYVFPTVWFRHFWCMIETCDKFEGNIGTFLDVIPLLSLIFKASLWKQFLLPSVVPQLCCLIEVTQVGQRTFHGNAD